MSRWIRPSLAVLLLVIGVSCGTVRSAGPASAARSGPEPGQTVLRSDARPLTPARSPAGGEGEAAAVSSGATMTTNAPPARALPKWNPVWWFGNVDDPEPPAWYRPGSPSRRWLWQLRNPLHNSTFYVIGVADQPFTRTGKFPAAVFAPDGGWNWAITRCGWLRLPFVSFNGEWGRCYLGWRERGNFGGKVNCGRTKPPDVIAAHLEQSVGH